jgi:hypothetical protein
MSLTKVSYSMIEAAPVNVADFGAVGDGVTDDTAAIQAAINSISEFQSGEIVFAPGKGYLVTDTISTNNRFLKISGNKAGLRIDASFTGTYVLEVINGLCTIEDLGINKGTAVVADGAIKVSGIRHRFNRVSVNDGTWVKCIHLIDCKESTFENIRIDNAPLTKTGTIFYLDYSVNNQITSCMLGYAQYGVFCSGVNHPTFSYRSEGLVFTDNITVFCDIAVRADAVTSLHVDNCVLDFCKLSGVSVANGITLFVSNTWIANESGSTSFAGIVAGSGFSGVNIHNNYFLANATGAGQDAFSSNATYLKATNNHIKDFNAGTINGSTSYVFGNTIQGSGTAFAGSAPVFTIGNGTFSVPNGFVIGSTTLPGQWNRNNIREYVDVKTGIAVTGAAENLLFSNYGGVPTMGHIYVQETGTSNYFIGVWYKQNVAATPVVTLLANSALTFSSANANGTVIMAGFTTPTSLKYTATIMAVHN